MGTNRITDALDREMVEKSDIPTDVGEYMLNTTRGITTVVSKHTKAGTPMDILQTYVDLLHSAGMPAPEANHYTVTVDLAMADGLATLIHITAQYMRGEKKFKRSIIICEILEFISRNMRPINREVFAINGDLVDVPNHLRCLNVLIHSMTHVYNESIEAEQ